MTTTTATATPGSGTSLGLEIQRSTLRTALAEIVPKIADAALGWMPAQIKDMLASQDGLFKRIAPIFASEAVGLGLVDGLKTALGDKAWAAKLIDPLDDFRSVFFAELGRKLREKHAPAFAGQEAMLNVAFPSTLVFVVPPDMDHYHHAGCPSFLGKRKIVTPAKPGSKGNPGTPASSEDRTDITSFSLDQVINSACYPAPCCQAMVMADINTMIDRAAKLNAAAKPKKEKVAQSFLEFIGQAQNGKIAGITGEQITAFQTIYRQLEPADRLSLHQEVNNVEEFVALVTFAKNVEDLKDLIQMAKDRRLHGVLADMLGLPASVTHKILVGGRKAVIWSWKEGRQKVWGQVKEWDGQLKAKGEGRAKSAKRLLAIEDFCRLHKVMDRTGFKAWALATNTDLTIMNRAEIPVRFMQGQRR